jgi:serine protease Do
MRKRTIMILAGAALAALSFAALPSRGQNGAGNQDDSWENLSRAEARLEAELARMQARLAAAQSRYSGSLSASQMKMETQLARAYEKMAQAEQNGTQVWASSGDAISLEGDSGWLGVSVEEVTADKSKELKLSAERGVVVTEVDENSPAAKAGLKVNDVITDYNGQRVEGTAQLRRLIRETPPGRTVQLTVWRDGRSQNISAQLGEYSGVLQNRVRVMPAPRGNFNFSLDAPFAMSLPKIAGSMVWGPVLGIGVQDLDGQLGNYFGAPDGEGVLITEVRSGSPAEKAGLKAGDVITKVDGTRVRSTSDLRSELRDKREKKTVSISLIRKGTETSLNVEIEQPKPPAARKPVTYHSIL